MCASHWQMLRAAIDRGGLGQFVAASGKEAVTRLELDAPSLFGPSLADTLGEGVVLTSEDLVAKKLLARLREAVPNVSAPREPLNPIQIDEIRGTLYPEIRVGWGLTDADIMRVMDREQERLARTLGEVHQRMFLDRYQIEFEAENNIKGVFARDHGRPGSTLALFCRPLRSKAVRRSTPCLTSDREVAPVRQMPDLQPSRLQPPACHSNSSRMFFSYTAMMPSNSQAVVGLGGSTFQSGPASVTFCVLPLTTSAATTRYQRK